LNRKHFHNRFGSAFAPPFKIGAPSIVFGRDLLENVHMLADRVDHIENQKSVLMDLLPLVLEAAHHRTAVTGLAKHGFERKFGLNYDPPLVRLRLLDPALTQGGFSDITVSLAELAQTDPGAKTVFITENKINGLAFPPVKHSLVIFGLGYGVEMLPDIPWLGRKELIYWGDIDTHGFCYFVPAQRPFPKCSLHAHESKNPAGP
jgi:hypothetical protein